MKIEEAKKVLIRFKQKTWTASNEKSHDAMKAKI